MAANSNVGKIFSTAERLVCCKVSIEMNIVSLKEPAFLGMHIPLLKYYSNNGWL